MFPSSTKREIRHCHVVVVQRRLRNVQKSVMHMKSYCFANLNLLMCCCTRCRRCRLCLHSLQDNVKMRRKILYYIHTEKYSPKSKLVRKFVRKLVLANQRSERWFLLVKKWYVQSESRTMFFHGWEKWYVQSEATEVCEFRAKITAFYCSVQQRFAYIQREKF